MLANGAQAHSFTRELGVSEAEFFRSLPAALEHRQFTYENGCVRMESDARTVTIELGEQAYRAIASLRLPYIKATFSFFDFSEAERVRFMQRFELYFRRGGG